MKRKYRIVICLVIAIILGVTAGKLSPGKERELIGGSVGFITWTVLFWSFCRFR